MYTGEIFKKNDAENEVKKIIHDEKSFTECFHISFTVKYINIITAMAM